MHSFGVLVVCMCLQESLNTSIALTEESLPEKTKWHFHQLVVFDYDSIIPTTALATLWDQKEFDAEEIMLGWCVLRCTPPFTGD